MRERVEEIRIDKIIDSPWQGRLLSVNSQQSDIVSQVKDIENSIKQNGILQPIVVRKIGTQFELMVESVIIMPSNQNVGKSVERLI